MTLPQTEVPTPRSSFRRAVGMTAASLLMIGIAAPMIAFASLYAPGPLQQPTTVLVERGTSVADISRKLGEANALYVPGIFRLAARFVGPLKAGEYSLPARATPLDIAVMMNEGRSVLRLFTAPEGLTSAEIVKSLMNDPSFSGAVAEMPREGSLWPESYRYNYGDTRASMIARMQKTMQDRLNEIWAMRDNDLPLTSVSDAVTLASIVEKETGKPEERARIAGVFYNRLRKNMRLQSDPTVIYALTQGRTSLDRPLTHSDLSTPSPINTYASDGLPPQPICNPGLAALVAVAHPERHSFFYFVADGSGGHAFAADLQTQNENINRWRKTLSSRP